MENTESNIKERILQISDYYKVNKEDFFRELGVSYANFKGVQKKSALNSDTIAKVMSNYPDINPVWLVCGTGDMLEDEIQLDDAELKELYEKVINLLEKKIEVLEERLSDKNKIIEVLEYRILLYESKESNQDELKSKHKHLEKSAKNKFWISEEDELKKKIDEIKDKNIT